MGEEGKEMSVGVAGIFAVMMLPIVCLGITLVYSHKATKHIGEEE